MWWQLPTEIINEILQFISFDDYVALTQTSSIIRRILDTQHQFYVVLDANTGADLRANELNCWSNKPLIWKGLGQIRKFLKLVDSIYPTNMVDPYSGAEIRKNRDQVIQTALDLFVTHSNFLIPTLLEFKLAQTELERNAAEALIHPKTFSVSRITWLRKLLQLHGFARTVEYSMSDESDEKSTFSLIEKCYFELSRCHIDFTELARYRGITLSRIRRDIRQFLPISCGKLKFRTMASYHTFLAQAIKIILRHLHPKTFKPGFAGNILRIYKGLGGETNVPYLAILAKVLEEEIFAKLAFDVGGKIVKIDDRFITSTFLVLGPAFVLIDLGTGECKFYEKNDLSRFPENIRPQITKKITVRTVIQRAFDSEEIRVPNTQEFLQQDWSNMHYSTSMIKLRFLRTILLEIHDSKALNENDFRPLIHNSDFFLYFHTAKTILLAELRKNSYTNLSNPSITPGQDLSVKILSFHNTTEHFSCTFASQSEQEQFASGDIIVQLNAEYFALVLGPEPHSVNGDRFISTLLFDHIEECSSLFLSLSNLSASQFGESFIPFIKWLISTDGLCHAGMFLFPNLQVTGEKLTLLPKLIARET